MEVETQDLDDDSRNTARRCLRKYTRVNKSFIEPFCYAKKIRTKKRVLPSGKILSPSPPAAKKKLTQKEQKAGPGRIRRTQVETGAGVFQKSSLSQQHSLQGTRHAKVVRPGIYTRDVNPKPPTSSKRRFLRLFLSMQLIIGRTDTNLAPLSLPIAVRNNPPPPSLPSPDPDWRNADVSMGAHPNALIAVASNQKRHKAKSRR